MRCLSASFWCACLLLAACGGGESSVSAPPSPGGTTPPPSGGVQRTTLSVTVRPESPDLLIVRTLGWPDAIPGATVVLRRDGGADVTTQTNAQGVATFTDLLEGNYQVTVSRVFAAAELSKLSPADRDLSAWGGARSVIINNAGGTLLFDVTSSAVRNGSLVISEILHNILLQPNGTRYPYSTFIELFNNADTTITLDGLLIAATMYPGRQYSDERCALDRSLYADTAGVWADIIYQLPPIGRRLKPGELAVIATDAIDHQPFGARDVYDLSKADYEIYVGLGDVDNPAVPNLISIGTVQGHSVFDDHGPPWLSTGSALALASPQDGAKMARRLNTAQNHDYLFIPRSTLLDVATTFAEDIAFPPLCAPSVGANIDAAPFVFSYLDTKTGVSLQRSRLPGSAHVRRTRSSARDFVYLAVTPFVVP